MVITILMDNNAPEGYGCEWGFAALVEYDGTRVLLDAGASPAFAENARRLDIDLSAVDYAVLSHAHFDHANGMPAFFEENDHAKFYLRSGAAENCYDLKEGENHYIGISRGTLSTYADRIEYVEGDFELTSGIWLIPHKIPGLAKEGARQNMLVCVDGAKNIDGTEDAIELVPDDFSHEQSLVIDTPEGLVVLSSCSHGGADVIIEEIAATFPGKQVRMLVGGLHLFLDSDERVRALAARIRELGIERIVTGHCTGDAAYAILREELGDVVSAFRVGLAIEM